MYIKMFLGIHEDVWYVGGLLVGVIITVIVFATIGIKDRKRRKKEEELLEKQRKSSLHHHNHPNEESY